MFNYIDELIQHQYSYLEHANNNFKNIILLINLY